MRGVQKVSGRPKTFSNNSNSNPSNSNINSNNSKSTDITARALFPLLLLTVICTVDNHTIIWSRAPPFSGPRKACWQKPRWRNAHSNHVPCWQGLRARAARACRRKRTGCATRKVPLKKPDCISPE